MDAMTNSSVRLRAMGPRLIVIAILQLGAGWGCQVESGADRQSHDSARATTPELTPNQISSKVDTQAKTIIWAGLQGTPPRYIDSGEQQGFGYNEVETKEVRAALVDAGFTVQREYYTSTRLQYEFTNKRPVCFYPVEWMPASETFVENPERILSLPLNFSGEEMRSIIFRKGEAHRFDRHFDAKGDLNLNSLIRDKSLNAVFPNNRDLPDEFKIAITRDNGVTNKVNQEFKDHISMIVPSENYQILAMLNGKRVDYTLSQFIESEDY